MLIRTSTCFRSKIHGVIFSGLNFFNNDSNTSDCLQGYPALFLIPNSKESTEGPVEYLGDW
jgi:hypothetical protein